MKIRKVLICLSLLLISMTALFVSCPAGPSNAPEQTLYLEFNTPIGRSSLDENLKYIIDLKDGFKSRPN